MRTTLEPNEKKNLVLKMEGSPEEMETVVTALENIVNETRDIAGLRTYLRRRLNEVRGRGR